jgi:hypothetical protein
LFPSPRQCSVKGNPCLSNADCDGGQTCNAINVQVVNDDVTASTTWTADKEYILPGITYVMNGATLTIEPGTVIRGEPNQPTCSVDEDSCTSNADCTDLSDPADLCLRNPGTLVVTRGSRLIADGNAYHNIVFTNLSDDNVRYSLGRESGDYDTFYDAFDIRATWGGLILLGRGYVANATAGPPAGPNPAQQIRIEGLQDRGRCRTTFNPCRLDSQCPGGGANTCDLQLGFYGNCAATPALLPEGCDDDDSGVMRYVSIRYGGDTVSAANEINGLTLGGVGRETELDYVEVHNNEDDGVELFGGAVDLKHFVLNNNGDDSVDYDEGWRGRGQFIFAMQGRGTTSDPRPGEHDGGGANDASQPRSIPTFYNVTYIGTGGVGGGTAGTSFYDPAEAYSLRPINATFIFRDSAGGHYYNSAFLNAGGALGLIEGTTAQDETSGERTVTAYALGDANTFASPVGSTPAGNCDDPLLPGDTATRAMACNADGDCPVGAVCVFHYQSRGDAGFELELEDNTFFCYGSPLLDGSSIAHLPATPAEALAAGGANVAHTDIPGLFNPVSGLDNQYLNCAQPLPIRELVRVVDPIDFPLGDTDNQPVIAVDPVPAAGSVLLTTNRSAPNTGFFDQAGYKGAFRGENWATKWTATSRLDLFPFCDGGTATGPVPDEVELLMALRGSALGSTTTELSWSGVQLSGLMGVQFYDVLRSTNRTDFTSLGQAHCELQDSLDLSFTDSEAVPAANGVYYYLVRAVNPCGDGPLGYRSNGAVRTGTTCN